MKKNQKFVKFMAMILAVLMLLSLLISVIPVYAHADVTQDDIDALKAQKSELSARVKDCRERLELLQGQQANVLETKAALQEQNRLAQEQIDIIQTQIDIYAEMISVKAEELEEAITREERQSLVRLLKALPLTAVKFRPIDEAIITSGGVSVKEISPKTMESKLVPGLYFAGEVIDVDAYTGGVNLQIAFATGRLAGEAAAM